MSDNEKLRSIILTCMETAERSSFASFDISDFMSLPGYSKVAQLQNRRLKAVLTKPYSLLGRLVPGLVRKFLGGEPKQYAQGVAVCSRGLLLMDFDDYDTAAIENTLNLVRPLRSSGYDYFCWGQPFTWYTRKVFPAGVPRATVTSQVAWAYIDLYEKTQKEKYLDIAKGCCEFFLSGLHITEGPSGTHCFSYTAVDGFCVHNANLLAASVLARVGRLSGVERYLEASRRSVRYSLHYQNSDGSWYYWGPPSRVLGVIDNYHTGFNLEALATIKDDLDCSLCRSAFYKGAAYYIDNLFRDGYPLHEVAKVYPVDIQSFAQAIITLTCDDRLFEENRTLVQNLLKTCIDLFYFEEKGHFGYRKYRNGFVDCSYYFRWGDSWMIRAISMVLNKVNDEKDNS